MALLYLFALEKQVASYILEKYAVKCNLIDINSTDPTAAPDGLIIVSIGSNYAEMRWNAPDPTDHNGIIRFYRVFITEEVTGRNFTLTSTTTQIVATDLHPFYTYTISVAAVTISPGPYSEQLSFRTLQDVSST